VIHLDSIPFNLTLDTPRCTLRIVSEDDVSFVWSASRFPGFTDGMKWNPPADQQELIEVNRRNLEAWRSGQAFTFTVVLKATQLPVGRIAIHAESQADVWSIGFWIHSEQWGHGLAAEAAKAVVEFGFFQLGAEVIRGAHATWNVQSKRVFEKLGLRFIGENLCGFEKNGKPVPELEYAMTKEEHSNISPQTAR
jgi:ribosomal-protein-alanine N-acetyltransferase